MKREIMLLEEVLKELKEREGRRGKFILPEISEGFSMPDFLCKVRAELIRKAMSISGGNYAKAGRLLGISTTAVFKACKNIRK